jgi:hypothetical protein
MTPLGLAEPTGAGLVDAAGHVYAVDRMSSFVATWADVIAYVAKYSGAERLGFHCWQTGSGRGGGCPRLHGVR